MRCLGRRGVEERLGEELAGNHGEMRRTSMNRQAVARELMAIARMLVAEKVVVREETDWDGKKVQRKFLSLPAPIIKIPRRGDEVFFPVSYTYNGGIVRNGKFYNGYIVLPPKVPAGYKLENIGVGLMLNVQPPLATMRLVKSHGPNASCRGLRRAGNWRVERGCHA